MESLLTLLTNTSIKDIEKNDFRIESYVIPKEHTKDLSDQESCIDDDESSHDDSTECSYNMEQTIASLDMNDYDSIKYTGNSAGLQLLDQNLFKSKSYLQLPGREDVALRLMSQNELLVVRSDRSGKKNTRLDVGFSLSSSIFDDEKDYQVPVKPLDLPSNALIQKAYHLCV
jgi:hypothetical protein